MTTAAATVDFDPIRPCTVCGLPVVELSFGGPGLCPWCDMGMYRTGERFTFRETMNPALIRARIKEESGMEGPRLPSRRLGVSMHVMSLEGSYTGFIPFAPDTIGEQGGDGMPESAEHEGSKDEKEDGVFLVPIEVIEQRSSFVVVKVKADSLEKAQREAEEHVRQLCDDGELAEHLGYSFEWTHDHYNCEGVATVEGDIEDYSDDIDLTKGKA
jgi:hypothetical protein